jgi:hypothetical protein
MMARCLALAIAGAFAVSVFTAGPAQAVCDPHCSPKSNKGGEVRGLDRANGVAGEHGQQGRDNAAAKQGVVSTPLPPPDGDRDGVSDADDRCPTEYAPGTSDGCPVVVLPPPGPLPGA